MRTDELQIPTRRQFSKYRDRDLGIGFLLTSFIVLLRFKRGFLIESNQTLPKEGIKRVSI